jgi:hypothetical protein
MNTWGDEALLKLSLSVVAMWEKTATNIERTSDEESIGKAASH